MFGNVYRRIAALPLLLKVLLAVAALILLGISVLLSPLVAFVALLVLIVAVVALIFRALRRRPLRNWALIALASLLFLIVFGGITNALYGGGAPQQASSPSEPKEEAEPTPPETTTEATTTPKTMAETPTGKAAPVSSKPGEEDAREEGGGDRGEHDATTTVTRVIDGDTLEINPAVDGNDRVRLIGVDTPETRDPGCVEPYGAEAKTFVDSELQGEEVELEFDEDREDQYDRLLAYVHDDGEMFNEVLLEGGYAQVYVVEPNDRHEDRLREAQEAARAAGRGLWGLPASELGALADRGNGIGGAGGCAPRQSDPKATGDPADKSEPQQEPTPPGPTPDPGGGATPPLPGGSCPDGAPIKGNRTSSTGDLIYHARRAVLRKDEGGGVLRERFGRGSGGVSGVAAMSPAPEHLKALEEVEREAIPGLVEVLREEGIDAVRYALWDATGWHRDYSPPAWRNRITKEQKKIGWEMAVRIEKIIATVMREAHERQVEETMEALSEGLEGFYKRILG